MKFKDHSAFLFHGWDPWSVPAIVLWYLQACDKCPYLFVLFYKPTVAELGLKLCQFNFRF